MLENTFNDLRCSTYVCAVLVPPLLRTEPSNWTEPLKIMKLGSLSTHLRDPLPLIKPLTIYPGLIRFGTRSLKVSECIERKNLSRLKKTVWNVNHRWEVSTVNRPLNIHGCSFVAWFLPLAKKVYPRTWRELRHGIAFALFVASFPRARGLIRSGAASFTVARYAWNVPQLRS